MSHSRHSETTGSIQTPYDDARRKASPQEHAVDSERVKGDREDVAQRADKEEAIRIADAVERDRGLGGKVRGLFKSVDLLTRSAIVTPYSLVSPPFAESPSHRSKLVSIRANEAAEEEEIVE